MLQIVIPGDELWDERKQEFSYAEEKVLQLEHSLVSLRKWESKWCKPFLSSSDKTEEEILDYVKCMTLTQNVKPEVYDRLTQQNVKDIKAYIEAPMTATIITDERASKINRETITAEIIYWWMIQLQIPVEFQKWHLNSLLTLIRVCNVKNTPPKKRGQRDTMSRNMALNLARRKRLNSKG